jgi:hypothetical protein
VAVICVPITKAPKRLSRGERAAQRMAGGMASASKASRGACVLCTGERGSSRVGTATIHGYVGSASQFSSLNRLVSSSR